MKTHEFKLGIANILSFLEPFEQIAQALQRQRVSSGVFIKQKYIIANYLTVSENKKHIVLCWIVIGTKVQERLERLLWPGWLKTAVGVLPSLLCRGLLGLRDIAVFQERSFGTIEHGASMTKK